MIDPKNPTNNITLSTTFLKFLFQGQKLAVYLVSCLLDILGFSYDDAFPSLNIPTLLFCLFLINVGWIAIMVYSVYEWKQEKAKLK